MTTGHERIYYSLHQLVQLSADIQDSAQKLEVYRSVLGDEHLDYVQDTSDGMLRKLHNMLQSCMTAVHAGNRPANPMENRDVRHDVRNLVAVIKGFSDLMRMDLDSGHAAVYLLDQVRSLSDEFVAVLDAIKAQAGTHAGAHATAG